MQILPRLSFDGKKSFSDQPVLKHRMFWKPTHGLNYRLYQLDGEFKSRFDLHDYPFDRQNLTIRFENLTTPSDRLTCRSMALDWGLPLSDTAIAKTLQLPLWQFKSIQYAKETTRTTSKIPGF
jgi:branched-chain amino acid transport system substrate-binding protein